MIECRIQRAQPADWQEVRAIRLRSLADSPEAFGTMLAEDQARSDTDWQARVENADAAHFLATAPRGECVGIAVGAPYIGERNSAGLFGMWVAPEVRGNKVGSLLVESVVDWAQNMNYRRIILDVADTNIAAIHLYESKGFIRTGRTGTLPPPRQHITEHERCLTLK